MVRYCIYIKDQRVIDYINKAGELGYRNKSHLVEEAVKALMREKRGLCW